MLRCFNNLAWIVLHAGALYDRGVYLYAMGYMGPNNDDMGHSVYNYLQHNKPDFSPKRILDLGCTVGTFDIALCRAVPGS